MKKVLILSLAMIMLLGMTSAAFAFEPAGPGTDMLRIRSRRCRHNIIPEQLDAERA